MQALRPVRICSPFARTHQVKKPTFTKIEPKTIVWDLDETLAHCVTENIDKADKQIIITLDTGEKVKVTSFSKFVSSFLVESTSKIATNSISSLKIGGS